eukprot:SAG11_NODE_2685_length_3101_cov_1.843771_4_plen_223_part_00
MAWLRGRRRSGARVDLAVRRHHQPACGRVQPSDLDQDWGFSRGCCRYEAVEGGTRDAGGVGSRVCVCVCACEGQGGEQESGGRRTGVGRAAANRSREGGEQESGGRRTAVGRAANRSREGGGGKSGGCTPEGSTTPGVGPGTSLRPVLFSGSHLVPTPHTPGDVRTIHRRNRQPPCRAGRRWVGSRAQPRADRADPKSARCRGGRRAGRASPRSRRCRPGSG